MARTKTTVSVRLDVGKKRSQNEDSLGCRQVTNDEEAREFGDLFVLADGMGGHAAGEVASRLAVDTILANYFSVKPVEIATSLVRAIAVANELIFNQANEVADLYGMGTTCVCSAIHCDKLYTAHVGDSRAYLLRGGILEQITQDHSWVEEQVRSGMLTPEEARRHPMKNVITRALGNAPDVDVDVSIRKIEAGDVLLICSDGLTVAVEDEDIKTILVSTPEPRTASDALVDRANDAGGPDNISVIIVRVDDVVPLVENPASQAAERRAKRGWGKFLPFS